jgi:glutamine amidotransferase
VSVISIGIVDYGRGNHASVINCLRNIGFRVQVSHEESVLDSVDVLLIPGVGAFPAAMNALQQRGLVDYLKEQADMQRPILGICLGMQLLASSSSEFVCTSGLNIIEGEIVPLDHSKWHIGWNTLQCTTEEAWLKPSEGEAFYFNHSFCYKGPNEYQIGLSNNPEPLVAMIRKDMSVGIQFHPEKSQAAGRVLLRNIILELTSHA